MADKNGYSVNNALATLTTISGLAAILGISIAAWQITEGWTPDNTNLLITVCGFSTVAVAASFGAAFFGYAYFRNRDRERNYNPPPPGFRPVIDGELIGPGYPKQLTGPRDPYFDPMPQVGQEAGGSFDEMSYIEDFAE
jgi:hypothetical protein